MPVGYGWKPLGIPSLSSCRQHEGITQSQRALADDGIQNDCSFLRGRS